MSRAVAGQQDGGTPTKWHDTCPLKRPLAWPLKPHFGSAQPGIPTLGTPSSQRGLFPYLPSAIFLVPPPQCPRTLSLAWREVAMYPSKLIPLDPLLSDVPAAGLAWSLDHQACSSESLPRGWAWPACLLPTSPHTGWSLHFLNSPQHRLTSFPPAPERALGSWRWVVVGVAQADSDGRVGMAGSSPGWHQRG